MMKFCNMNLSKTLFLIALITLNVLLVPVLSAPISLDDSSQEFPVIPDNTESGQGYFYVSEFPARAVQYESGYFYQQGNNIISLLRI